MKKTTYLVAIFFAFYSITYAQTALNPVSATTTFTPDYGTVLANTYNGVGLVTTGSLTSDHIDTDIANSFVANEITGSIDFNLGGTYDVIGLSFWNQNDGGPSTTVGVNGVAFSYSIDGITYTSIPSSPTVFAEVLTGLSAPEQFSFSTVSAAYIRMEVLSNHGDPDGSGFAEIAFSTTGPTLSIENSKTSVFSLYPNPASNNVVVSSNYEAATIEIYNMTGKQIMNRKLNFGTNHLNVSKLASGIYLARFVSESKIETKKLIIK